MKFTVTSTILLKTLQSIVGAINPNPVIPVLEDFLFEIEDNKLTITTSDLEVIMVTSIDVTADSNGKIAIPSKLLLETLKTLPQQPVTFHVNDEFGIELVSSFGSYKMVGEDGADYPELPKKEEVDHLTIDPVLFQEAIHKTIFATSTDELRLAMTGVYFQIEEESLTMVATDAHKLVKCVLSDISASSSASMIVPRKALQLIKGLLRAGEPIKISYNRTNAFFQFNDIYMICRLVDSVYPEYNAVIPIDNPNSVLINRVDFQNSLKRIAIFANKTTNQVMMNIGKDEIQFSAQDIDFSNEAHETLKCVLEGEPTQIGFNAKFLLDMLTVLETDEVRLDLEGPKRPGIIFPSEQSANMELLMLLMPIMI